MVAVSTLARSVRAASSRARSQRPPDGVPPIDPATLFAAGEKGWWYDPSDFSTMFQDAGGTTPVTAIDQPVGLLMDKSGNGNHITQTTDVKRPILRQDGDGYYYLESNGNYKLETPAGAFAMGSAAEYWVFSAERNTVSGCCFDIAINLGGPGAQRHDVSSNQATFGIRSATSSVATLDTEVALGNKYVLTTGFNLPAADVITDAFSARVNGADSSYTYTGSGNLFAQPGMGNVYLGLLGLYGAGSEVTGRSYGFIMRAAPCSAEEIAGVEAYMNQQIGAF